MQVKKIYKPDALWLLDNLIKAHLYLNDGRVNLAKDHVEICIDTLSNDQRVLAITESTRI